MDQVSQKLQMYQFEENKSGGGATLENSKKV